LEPQPWAIIGGAANSEQCKTLIKNIDKELRQPSKIGAIILNKAVEAEFEAAGVGTNGGVWPSINGTLIKALSLVDGEMAWDEWKKNTLTQHADAFPDIWYGIWSGPDFYSSVLSNYPGQTGFDPGILSGTPRDKKLFLINVNWTDFPVMNMHPHAWPLYNVMDLIGLKVSPEGIELAPILPKDEYEISTPLLGFKKLKEGYAGWYGPKIAGSWKITLTLSNESELSRFTKLKVNEKELKIIREENKIIFKGESTPEKPLRWMVS
jgi:hypothetical protein